jgi:hypothetical protein
VNLVSKLCESYFAQHSGEGNPILLLVLFGFEAGKPWIAKVTWDRQTGVQSAAEWATDSTLVTVGQDQLFRQYAEDWRTRIQRHKEDVAKKIPPATDDATFEQQLEISRHDVAERKSVEEEMLRGIESEFAASIGGVLQRLELGMEDGRVVAGFTHDDRPYLDGASYTVTPGTVLAPIPIVEKMGRQVRKPNV